MKESEYDKGTATDLVLPPGKEEESRALMIMEPAATIDLPARPRPDAAFVAQLIANVTGSPQTRILRRAGNDEARAVYDAQRLRRELAGTPRHGLALSRLS